MSIIQWFTVFFTLIMMFLSLRRFILIPDKRALRIPILLLGTHTLLFYFYIVVRCAGIYCFPHLTSSEWSAVLRLHAMITYSFLEMYGYMKDKRRRKYE